VTRQLPPSVVERLGHYVYLYIDPSDGSVFYIGKGQGSRALAHLDDESETEKTQRIRDIRAKGQEPTIELLAHGLPSEAAALQLEAAAIDLLGVRRLTNRVRGHDSASVGRMPLQYAVGLYSAEPGIIDDPVMLIRINRLFRFDMSDQELYEATRGVWKVGVRRKGAKLAIAVFRGVAREVYAIDRWVPAGSSPYMTKDQDELKRIGRWEFVGRVAEPSLREKYKGKSLEAYLPSNAQNPVTYVNC
jgi:hypothetical protein